MAELEKHLEKADKYASKNKFEPAIEEYKAALELAPHQHDLLRTIADLCIRAGRTEEANEYYGRLFDIYVKANEAGKAALLFRKSLQRTPQPPERHHKLGYLLQRARKDKEAAEAYRGALALFQKAGNAAAVLDCLERLAGLEPNSAENQIRLGEQANKLGRAELAGKAFLRAGQLFRADDPDRALQLLQRAYQLAPERTAALSLAQAHLERGHHQQAADLLLPLYAGNEDDPALLETLAAALLAGKRLREAEGVLQRFYQLKPDSYEKLFEVAALYCQAGEVQKAVAVLGRVKERLFASKRQREFLNRLEHIYQANQSVTPLAEYAAAVFNEANQESRYAAVLSKLFDLYHQSRDYPRAVEVLERLIEIDPYDFANQRRLERLKGKLDQARWRAVAARISSVTTTTTGQASVFAPGEKKIEQATAPVPGQQQALLEDLMVQAEIFLQYSLRTKAIEKLQKIQEMFPGEVTQNPRLYELCEQAECLLEGSPAPPAPGGAPAEIPAPAAAPAPPAAPLSGGTVSDLAKMSEVTHALYRQTTPKNILHTAVSELGKYLHASRCLGTLGQLGAPASSAVEFCAAGVSQSSPVAIVKLLGLLSQIHLDPANGGVLDVNMTPELKQLGAQSALAMPLTNKEKQQPAGLIVLSQADYARQWQPHEVYLLRAVADQVETAIAHTQLRSLMRKLAVADEGTGLLARSSYLDCLVSEVTRAKAQGTPLVVALLELDRGGQLLRQVGEAAIQKFMQHVSETLLASVRQSDTAVRYTATSLSVVLGDTTAEKAQAVVEKLRQKLSALPPPGGNDSITFSAGMSEAAIRPDYDPLDIVTDVINRAEFSLEEARRRGNAIAVQ